MIHFLFFELKLRDYGMSSYDIPLRFKIPNPTVLPRSMEISIQLQFQLTTVKYIQMKMVWWKWAISSDQQNKCR